MRNPGFRAVAPWLWAAAAYALLTAWFWNRGPGFDADDYAHTLLHAQALVDGRPYGDTGYITSPLVLISGTQPPGLPVLVAAVMFVTGGFHWGAIKLAMAVTALPFLVLAGAYFGRTHGHGIGVAVTAMLAVTAAPIATHVQSDLGFASLVWGALFLLDHRPDRQLTWWRVLAVFLLASGAMAYRFVGAALVPTAFLFALANRKHGGLKLGAPLAVWGVGGIVVIAVAGWSAISQQVSLYPLLEAGGIPELVRFYSVPAVEAHLYPLPWNVANDVFHVVSMALAIVGIVAWTRTSWRSAAWLFMVCYLTMLSLVWARAGRYLFPLYPVLIFGFMRGVTALLPLVRKATSQALARRLAAGAGLAVAILASLVLLVQEPRTGGYLAEQPDAREVFAYFTSQRSPEDTRVAFVQARTFIWNTGIPAMILPEERPAGLLAELDRLHITHVILDRLDLAPVRTLRMRETLATYACRFEETFENGSFEVYRVLPPCDDEA